MEFYLILDEFLFNPSLWIDVNWDSDDAINLVLVLITIDWCYYTYVGYNWLVDGKTMMIDIDGDWVSLYYPNFNFNYDGFVIDDVVQLMHDLWLA